MIIKTMEFIPSLSQDKSQWLANQILSIINADNIITDKEDLFFNQFCDHFGLKRKEIDANLPLPQLTFDETQYILRMLFLSGYADGNLSEIEIDRINQITQQLNEDPVLIDLAKKDVVKSIFFMAVMDNLESILKSSEVISKTAAALGLQPTDRDNYIKAFRSML